MGFLTFPVLFFVLCRVIRLFWRGHYSSCPSAPRLRVGPPYTRPFNQPLRARVLSAPSHQPVPLQAADQSHTWERVSYYLASASVALPHHSCESRTSLLSSLLPSALSAPCMLPPDHSAVLIIVPKALCSLAPSHRSEGGLAGILGHLECSYLSPNPVLIAEETPSYPVRGWEEQRLPLTLVAKCS